jgi:branched-chain amino acid transport system substrate-binding protein
MNAPVTRREWLKLSGMTSVGVAAGLGGPYVLRKAAAQDKGPIKIGFPVPLSGIYGDYANDQVNGAQLAVDEWNAKGGVLGRKVELLTRDDQLQVDVITRLAKELVENDKVTFLSGALGEHTILAMNEVSRAYKVPFVGINQSNDIFTGKNFNKYTFLEAFTPYMSVAVLAKWAVKEWKPKRVFTIGPDYQWGWNNRDQWKRHVQAAGGQIVGEIIYPFKHTDYTPFMQRILDAKPDVLCAANFGDEQVLFLKQAVPYGLQKKMRILLTLTGITPRVPAGDEAFENIYGGTTFYWELAQSIASTKRFVDAFEKKHPNPPGDYGANAYSAVRLLLDTAQKIGTVDADKIVAAIENLKYDHYKGQEWMRPCTHQSFQDFYVLKNRPKPEGKWGYFQVVHKEPMNESLERSCDMLRKA